MKYTFVASCAFCCTASLFSAVAIDAQPSLTTDLAPVTITLLLLAIVSFLGYIVEAENERN